jgi:antibiotic biosynthesis monooxygenase (ABM) superfamily enzyme
MQTLARLKLRQCQGTSQDRRAMRSMRRGGRMESMQLTMVAALYINPGKEADFERFELAAAGIMRRYGGAITRRIRCAKGADQSAPYEIHILDFPDAAAFASYRNDAELGAMAELRTSAIRQTTVWSGVDLPPYPS